MLGYKRSNIGSTIALLSVMQIETNVPDLSELTGKQGTLYVAPGRTVPEISRVTGFRDGHVLNVRTANLATFLIQYITTHNIIWEG